MNGSQSTIAAVEHDDRLNDRRYHPVIGEVDARLLAIIEGHVGSEVDLLRSYQAVAENDPADYVRYLTDLIISDEKRHHQLLVEMANNLRAGIAGGDTSDRVPWLVRPKRPGELQRAVDALIRRERRDRRELKRLRRALRPRRKTSLLSPLVETMLLDTRKHIVLLRAIRRSASI